MRLRFCINIMFIAVNGSELNLTHSVDREARLSQLAVEAAAAGGGE